MLRATTLIVMASALVQPGHSWAAEPVCYAYDGLGRLTGVIDQNSHAALYEYDAVGNVLAIRREDPSGPVTIYSFDPPTGAPGSKVEIFGVGFGAAKEDNAVTIGGTTATVVSTLPCTLVVEVPDGATGGEIAITTPLGQATSHGVFVVSTTTTTVVTTTSTSSTTTIPQPTELRLVLVARPDPITPGDLLTFEATVTNRGPVDASGVHLTVPVPAGMAGTSGCQGADGGTFPQLCTPGQSVTWSLGALPIGTSRTVQVTFLTNASAAVLPDGAIVHGSARVADAAGDEATAGADVTVHANAPLMLDLVEDADPVVVDDTIEYTLRYGNRSAATTQPAAELTVTLPPGLSGVSAADATVGTDTVTWTLGDLAPGETGERRLRATVATLGAADPLVRLARAVITSGATAARASAVTTVETAPLALVMVATPDPVGRGELLTYELTVTNHRPGTADDVQLFVPVPQGMSGTSGCPAASDGGTLPQFCTAGRDVAWSLGPLPTGTSRTVQVTFLTHSSTATLAEGALVFGSARVRDKAGGAARAGVSTPVQTGAPLMLGLTEDADPVAATDTIEYTVRYGNRSGATTLPAAQLTVTLPAGFTGVTADGATVGSDTVSWALEDLLPGQVGERRLRATVAALGAADPLLRLTRAAVASGDTAARASAVTTVEPAPLGLVMVATPDPVGRGELLTYEVTVTNHRPGTADDVQLFVPVPQAMFGSSGCRAASDGGAVPQFCSAGDDVTWSLGPLPTGTSRTVHVTFVTHSSTATLTEGALLFGSARVRDMAGGSARANVSTPVQTGAPLMVGLTENADPIAATDTIEYTVRYGNRSAATTLPAPQLTVMLPAGFTGVTAEGATVGTDTVSWALEDLPPGQVGERRLQATVATLGAADPLVRLTRAVVASGDTAARASAVTTVEPAPLGLVMVATPDPVGRGEILTYELTVTNHRAATAENVQLFVPVPEGMLGTSGCRAASDGGTLPQSCNDGKDVAWSLGPLPTGTSRTVHVTFVTHSSTATLAEGALVFGTARVRDMAGGAARAGVSTPVQTGAPLMLGLTEDADPVAATDTIEYTVRYGNRSAGTTLPAAQLTVTLPAGFTGVTAQDATVGSDTVIWALGDVAPGQAGERRLQATVATLGAADPLLRLTRAVVASGETAARASAVTTLGDAPLGLVLVASPDPVGRNASLMYTLTVTNRRAVSIDSLQLRMPVPPGMAGTSGCTTVSGGGTFPQFCSAGADVTWNLGPVAVGDTTVTVTFHTSSSVPNGTIVPATARVRDTAGGASRAGRSVAVGQ